jgi:hypothetical protein
MDRILTWATGVPRWAWIAGGAVVLTLLLLWRAYAMGRDAGRDSREPELARLTLDLQTARLNADTLESAVKMMRDDVLKLQAAGKAAKADAAKAENRAKESRRGTSALRARLEADSRLAGGKPAAALTPAQKEAWDALSRRD